MILEFESFYLQAGVEDTPHADRMWFAREI